MRKTPEEYHQKVDEIAPSITPQTHITELSFLPTQVAFLLMKKHQVTTVKGLVELQRNIDLIDIVGIGPVSISSLDYLFTLRPDLLVD
jgi:hypothetical protein